MNTLTQFIDAQFSLNDHLTAKEKLNFDEANASGLYEIIENEEIKSSHSKGLAISGSLFSLTTFTDITFESCVFYASKLENCTFINCNFIDCKFEFTGLQHCRFNGCSVKDTVFSVSPIKKCTVAFSEFDHKFAHFLNKEENHLISCKELEPLTWEDVLEGKSEVNNDEVVSLPPIPTEAEQKTASLRIDLMTALQQVFNKNKAA